MDSPAGGQMENKTYRSAPDEFLVQKCQAGDRSAFAELMSRHQTPALKIAMSMLRHRQDAEDEVQNAFWKAYQNIKRFQQEARFSTWLTRIVVNQCLMRLRQAKRARFSHIDEHAGDILLTREPRDSRQTPEQSFSQAQMWRVLRQEIRRTPPLLRHVFLLRDVQCRPMPEVAEQLGISVAAAKSRLLRARAELRNRISRHYAHARMEGFGEGVCWKESAYFLSTTKVV
jgi:RNA polymerase sigma-70 factor, ECF subfamily